jgi:hypothetical protein
VKDVKVVFSDFDGTLTHNDELTPHFFEILELLKRHGVPLVVCTGRSKSWAHFLLTHFHDLEYVISEGGGTLSYIEKREGRRLLKDKSYVEVSELERLGNLTTELLIKFPEVMLSADSFGRQADRAIELYELSDNPEMKEEVVAFFEKEEINYSTSNVHMNFWCGEISKMKAINTFLSDTKLASLEESLFFGDSLNDESVFKDHPRTIGVANIKKVQDRFKHLPKEVLVGSDKEGPLGVLSYLREVLK